MIPERRRLPYALLLSLLIHTWLLSLTFAGRGLGLPDLAFPWQDRRIDAPDLRVVLVPQPPTAAAPVGPAAEPPQQASAEQPVANGPTPSRSVSRAPTAVRLAPATVSEAQPKAEAHPETETNPRTPPATAAATAKAPLRTDRSRKTAPPPLSPIPPVIALERIDEDTWVVPAAPAMPTPIVAAPPALSIPEIATPSLPEAGDAARARIDLEASAGAAELGKLDPSKQEQQQAQRMEAALQESARQAAALQEAARQAAAQEAQRQEVARREEAARAAAAHQEAERQEAARQAAAQEAQRQEVARREEAARAAAARQEAERQETARQAAAQEAQRQEVAHREEAARAEAARQEGARQEAARVRAEEEEKREARLRAIGRQLDEEAAQRETIAALRAPGSLPPPAWRPARRYRLFGRTDPDEEIIRYAEAWERKIELNMTLDMVREAAKQPHTDPMVTVAIRSDGSVESVTFVQSSGVPAIDNAIRLIVDSQKPYRVFPPKLASEYDVIEIRRTWHFDMAIRLY